MKENVIKAKSFAFALRIVKLYQFLRDEKHEFVLSRQLLKSGTAIGEHWFGKLNRQRARQILFISYQ